MSFKNISTKILLTVAALAVLAGGAAIVVSQQDGGKKPKAATSQQATDNATPQSVRYVAYDGVEGKTALALLKEKNSTVVTKDTSYGPFVESINGLKGSDNDYWAFYVNGKQASVGADAYKTKAGDKIEWKFE